MSASKKRRREEEDDEIMAEEAAVEEGESEDEGSRRNSLGFTFITRYRNMLGVDFLNSEEIVVIERPISDVLAELPPAYFKARYGS